MDVKTLDEYQDAALGTAKVPSSWMAQRMSYGALKLAGEAGEYAEKVGKAMRTNGQLEFLEAVEQQREPLAKELGDVLWYVAFNAAQLGYQLSEIAALNLNKLADRDARGVTFGNGDDR